jgi:hypothetical protein
MIVSTVIQHEFVKKTDLGQFLKAHERHAPRFTKAVVILIDDKEGDWKCEWSSFGMVPSEVYLGMNLLQDKIKEQLQTVVSKDLKL